VTSKTEPDGPVLRWTIVALSLTRLPDAMSSTAGNEVAPGQRAGQFEEALGLAHLVERLERLVKSISFVVKRSLG